MTRLDVWGLLTDLRNRVNVLEKRPATGGGGGGGTVTSVNGDPGPAVVLGAGDVGADPAGSAAAAQAAAEANSVPVGDALLVANDLSDVGNDAAARTNLGLGTMAVETATDYVPKSLYDANGLLISVVDNTPVFKAVATSTILGRKATGDIDDMTTAELAALFGTPTGTKFLADDGTLKVPAGGGSGLDPFLLMGG